MRAERLPATRIRGRFWRMLAPRWAADPLSGDGAAKHGGRFNQPGCSALYMSEDLTTAVAEYEQDLGIRPGTLVAYDVDGRGVVDLTDAQVRRRLGVAEALLRIPWKQLVLVERRRPPTWALVDRLLGLGATAIRVPSVRGSGRNLVLYRWNAPRGCKVQALDPLGDLRRR